MHRPNAALAAVELDVDVLGVVGEGGGLPAARQETGNCDDVVYVFDGMGSVLTRDSNCLEGELSAFTLGVGGGGRREVGAVGCVDGHDLR